MGNKVIVLVRMDFEFFLASSLLSSGVASLIINGVYLIAFRPIILSDNVVTGKSSVSLHTIRHSSLCFDLGRNPSSESSNR